MLRLINTLILSTILLGYSLHLFIDPFIFFSNFEFLILFLGVFAISFSIVSTPLEFMEQLGRLTFSGYKMSAAKSLFIGLVQFVILQLIGWHLIAATSTISHGLLLEEWAIDADAIVQTAGTIASLIFAGFQTVTASAENQYEIKGRLRFDKNDELYFYLRLTLSSAVGAFIGQRNSLPVVMPFAQCQLILSILFLLPLISILFKSFKPDSILNKSKDFAEKNIPKFFAGANSGNHNTQSFFENINNSLTQVSIVSAWCFKHKVNIHLGDIRAPFTQTFSEYFNFLYILEENNYALNFHQERVFQDLCVSRTLSFVDLSQTEIEALNYVPMNFPRNNLDFLDGVDFPLRALEVFFLPFRNLIISSLQFNGAYYAKVQDLLTDFIENSARIRNITWRKALYLMMLGDFVDGILSLPTDHNADVEITHLWFLLLRAQNRLNLVGDQSIARHFEFAKEQFELVLGHDIDDL